MNLAIPSLENVSFENNNISELSQLDNLVRGRYVELMFSGNDIAVDPNYQRYASPETLEPLLTEPIVALQ